MNQDAQARLWTSLRITDNFEPVDIPQQDDPNREDFLWEALLDDAREDGNLLSFFVVMSSVGGASTGIYVSPDWPSAEAAAKSLVGGKPSHT